MKPSVSTTFPLCRPARPSRRRRALSLSALAAATLTFISAGTPAHAEPIDLSPDGLDDPVSTVAFDEVAIDDTAPVTTQFAALGLTFVPNLYYRVGDNPDWQNVSGPNLRTGDPEVNPFSIKFGTPLSSASFVAIAQPPTPTTITAKLNGVEVESFETFVSIDNPDNHFGFTDIIFDEIVVGYTEATRMRIDNVQLGAAAEVQDPLADGLVAYWPLDGSTDDVIGGFDGEPMGAAPLTYDAGKLGGAGVDLDGIDQFIQISGDEDVFDFGAPDEPTGFTISAWFRVDAFEKSWQCLVAKGEGNRWRVHRRGADVPAVFAANGGNADVPAYNGDDYPIADEKFHHVAVVSYPEDRVELWLDGDLVSTGPAPVLENGANPMMIGENPDARGRTWNGGIDDVAAWKRPLSEDEVQRVYAEGQAGNSLGDLLAPGGDPSLIGWWPLNEGSGEFVNDASGHHDASEIVNADSGGLGDGGAVWMDAEGDNLPAFLAGTKVASFNGVDGSGAYIFLGDDVLPLMTEENEFTWTFWANSQQAPNNDIIFGNRYMVGNADFSPRQFIKFTTSNFEWDTNNVQGVPYEDIPQGEWMHHAVVKKGLDFVYYRNGEEFDVGIADAAPEFVMPLFIAGQGVENWAGMMADVAILDRALSEQEIEKVFASGVKSLAGGSNNDRDGDGLPNYYEEANGLNPDDPADAAQDGDNDGLTNLQEYEQRTDPAKADTDGDGLKDGVETGTGVWASATDTGTLPTKADSDKDGLPDGVETRTGTFVSATDTGTDPNKADTDGDTFSDGQELVAGSNPNDANSKPEGGLLAAWDFEDSGDDSVAVDVISGIEAVNGGAEYVDDDVRGSVMEFVNGSGASLWVEDASFLNLAAATDQITFVFWQLNLGTPDSSTFWAVSPSSSGGARGAQAHVPWSNNNIYFDTVGCCDGNQRGNFDASEFFNDEWHHYAFVKDGEDKRVYIDGQLEFEIVNPSPLPDDFTELWIGSATGQTNVIEGRLDDFGVYSIALSEEQINEVMENGFGGGGVPFQILDVKRVTPTNAEVTWQSRSGRSYSIDHTTNLVDWVEGTDGFEADGDTATYEDDTLTPDTRVRYYRVREE